MSPPCQNKIEIRVIDKNNGCGLFHVPGCGQLLHHLDDIGQLAAYLGQPDDPHLRGIGN